MVTETVEEQLRAAGLKVTAARVATLTVLNESHDHPRVEQIIERVRGSGVNISTQAGYDVCEALHDASLARKIALAGGPTRYEARVGDNHHHLVCRTCGHAVDVDCATGDAPCLDLHDNHGFDLEEAEVTYWGTCPNCKVTNNEGITA